MHALSELCLTDLELMGQLDDVVQSQSDILVVLFVVLFQVAESAVQQRR
jgi:hypothetical protein